MFTSYPAQISPLITALKSGTAVNFDRILVSEHNDRDLVLYNMEKGRAAQVVGSVDASMDYFARSIGKIQENELKAYISAVSVAENSLAILTNDNAISYEGDGYEQVMLHHYQALNYLKKNNIEGAGVEIRRANNKQEEALKEFESELEAAQKAAAEQHISDSSKSLVISQYGLLDEISRQLKNSFQNAYTFYLSGFVYELLAQPNDAYIDYKRALEIYPDNGYLQKDVIRLASSLNMSEDLDTLKTRFRPDLPPKRQLLAGSGDLLVILEDGFVPQKKEVKIAIPIHDAGFVSMAFPIYQALWTSQLTATVSTDDELLGRTEPICDIRALAVKALKEKAPVIATRQIIRAFAKGLANSKAKKKIGPWGEMGMSILNYATENADLRSWNTLPSNAQLLRTSLSPGTHRISIRFDAGNYTYADVEIPENGKSLLLVTRTGKSVYTQQISFPALPLKASGNSDS